MHPGSATVTSNPARRLAVNSSNHPEHHLHHIDVTYYLRRYLRQQFVPALSLSVLSGEQIAQVISTQARFPFICSSFAGIVVGFRT